MSISRFVRYDPNGQYAAQAIRVKRQIKHHQLVSKLEVTAFWSRFHYRSAPERRPLPEQSKAGFVTLENRHAFVEYGGANASRSRNALAAMPCWARGDNQNFRCVWREFFQQPVYP